MPDRFSGYLSRLGRNRSSPTDIAKAHTPLNEDEPWTHRTSQELMLSQIVHAAVVARRKPPKSKL